MKRLILLTAYITILALGYTNEKVYAMSIAEEGVAGISLILNNINPIEIKIYTYNWTTERANLRSKQSTDSNIIKTIDKRTKVEVLEVCKNWTKVKYDGITGYIYSTYLTDKELFTSDNNRWGIELTDDEIDLLAKIVWTESRGEIDRGKYAAIEIIFNRMYSLTHPDTLLEVLSQDGQFTSWKLRNQAKPEEDIYECIEEVLRNDTNELTMDYMYFSTSPRNNHGTIKIGNHYFCKED